MVHFFFFFLYPDGKLVDGQVAGSIITGVESDHMLFLLRNTLLDVCQTTAKATVSLKTGKMDLFECLRQWSRSSAIPFPLAWGLGCAQLPSLESRFGFAKTKTFFPKRPHEAVFKYYSLILFSEDPLLQASKRLRKVHWGAFADAYDVTDKDMKV